MCVLNFFPKGQKSMKIYRKALIAIVSVAVTLSSALALSGCSGNGSAKKTGNISSASSATGDEVNAASGLSELGIDPASVGVLPDVKHDAQNEKRKNAERKPSAKQLAAAEYDAKLIEAIDELLTDEFQLRTAFAEALDITPSKASTLLNKMVKAGTVEKGEVKGEKGKQVGYKRA